MESLAIGVVIGIVGTLAALWGALVYTARERADGPWGPEVRVSDDEPA